MDCFIDFYERLDAFSQQPTIIKDDEKTGPIEDLIASDLSNNIDARYFDNIDYATSTVVTFYEDYIADTRLHVALHERMNTRRRKNYDDLKLMLMIDVVRAYEGLHHSTRLNSPEGIALFLLLVKMFRPDYFVTYEGLKTIPEDIINLDGLVPYISACSAQIDIPEKESVISSLLMSVRPKAERIYRIILYRLFESVAQVDGVITMAEQDYLRSLLNLDDEDIKNDIVIDSIFSEERVDDCEIA